MKQHKSNSTGQQHMHTHIYIHISHTHTHTCNSYTNQYKCIRDALAQSIEKSQTIQHIGCTTRRCKCTHSITTLTCTAFSTHIRCIKTIGTKCSSPTVTHYSVYVDGYLSINPSVYMHTNTSEGMARSSIAYKQQKQK